MKFSIEINFERRSREEELEEEPGTTVNPMIQHSSPSLPSPVPEEVVTAPKFETGGYAMEEETESIVSYRHGVYL